MLFTRDWHFGKIIITIRLNDWRAEGNFCLACFNNSTQGKGGGDEEGEGRLKGRTCVRLHEADYKHKPNHYYNVNTNTHNSTFNTSPSGFEWGVYYMYWVHICGYGYMDRGCRLGRISGRGPARSHAQTHLWLFARETGEFLPRLRPSFWFWLQITPWNGVACTQKINILISSNNI